MPADEATAVAIQEAFAEDDLLQSDGFKRDNAKMHARIFAAVSKAKVLNKNERATKSISKGELVTAVFPNLVGPDDYENENDVEVRGLFDATYKEISKIVWAAATDAPNGPVQRLVGIHMGNGYVLCRAKVGLDRIDVTYVTDDLECIRLDFTRPDNESLERKIRLSTTKREMLVLRQPQNGRAYAGELNKTLRSAIASSTSQIQLALDAVASRLAEPDDSDETSDETDD